MIWNYKNYGLFVCIEFCTLKINEKYKNSILGGMIFPPKMGFWELI